MKILNKIKAMIVNKKKNLFVLLIAFLSLAFIQSSATAQEFMDISEVRKGMTGIAKTVVLGQEVEEFGIEVLDIMKNQGPAGDLILIRAHGDVIERTGGIASGMSGSPVYINGKLVGAVAYGFNLTDHKTAMVTPIKDMLKIWDIDAKNDEVKLKEQEALALKAKKEKEAKKKERLERKEAEQKKALEKDKENKTELNNSDASNKKVEASKIKQDEKKEVVPKSSVIQVSGLSERAFSLLSREMGRYGVELQQAGSFDASSEASISYKKLQPGDMVGVQLIRGDVSLASFGTVTYVENDRILAYGHPFMKRGNCNYILTEAKVYNTLSALNSPVKLSCALSAIGTATQDRSAGISGKLGVFPRIVPMQIHVHDKTLDKTRTFYLQLAHDEELTPLLAAISVYNAVEKTSDRTGSGTVKVKFEINAQDLPVKSFVRENMFYSNSNIAEIAIVEVLEGISILTSNKYNSVNIVDVRINIEVDDEKRTASILEVKPEKLEVKRGETFEVEVKVKPFRKEEVIYKANFTVPKDQPLGNMMLNVRGGGVLSLNTLLSTLEIISLNKESLLQLLLLTENETATFKSEINDLIEREQYNDIVVEILKLDVDSLGAGPNNKTKKKSKAKSSEEAVEKKENKEDNTNTTVERNYDFDKDASFSEIHEYNVAQENKKSFKVATDQIITGETQFVVTVVE